MLFSCYMWSLVPPNAYTELATIKTVYISFHLAGCGFSYCHMRPIAESSGLSGYYVFLFRLYHNYIFHRNDHVRFGYHIELTSLKCIHLVLLVQTHIESTKVYSIWQQIFKITALVCYNNNEINVPDDCPFYLWKIKKVLAIRFK